MSSRDQPSGIARRCFLGGHHRLLVEQLARIAGQDQIGLERSDALVRGSRPVALHARGAFDDAGGRGVR